MQVPAASWQWTGRGARRRCVDRCGSAKDTRVVGAGRGLGSCNPGAVVLLVLVVLPRAADRRAVYLYGSSSAAWIYGAAAYITL